MNPPPVDHDIRYLADGSIESKDTRFNDDLNDTLNLNLTRLKNNRRAVLDGLKGWAERIGTLRDADIQAELKEWQEIEKGLLQEYVQVAVYWLNKRLTQT